MKIKNKRSAFVLLAIATALAVALAAVPSSTVSAAGGEVSYVQWKNNFGGMGDSYFQNVIATSDGGFVAVGTSGEDSFGTGDLTGLSEKGWYDAVIVKFDANGTLEWAKNFGGEGDDNFNDVIETDDGFIAIGFSGEDSFGNGDWSSTTSKGVWGDAIIVKFDTSGGVVWSKNFGGDGGTSFESVTATADSGFLAVGHSYEDSYGTGDFTSVMGKGDDDAIIVKFDADGDMVWVKNFGGEDEDRFNAVITLSDGGFVAVGHSYEDSFGNGDWSGVTGKGGGCDAIIVKYGADGIVEWAYNFGGSSWDRLYSVAETSDGGFVSVGFSEEGSFGNGDWLGIPGKGGPDAFVVKFDANGDVAWKRSFGGEGGDYFYDVKTTSDGGVIVIGNSNGWSFGTGDWINTTSNGGWMGATLLKFDADGGVVWAKNFGGGHADFFNGVTVVADGGFVVAGGADINTFGTGDWEGFTGKGGWEDAIIVKFGIIIQVDEITGISSSATAGKPFTLNGTVTPSDATYKTITWSIKNAGTTGATLSGNVLSTTGAGTVIVTATIDNGLDMGIPYTKDFTINVKAEVVNTFIPVTDITLEKTSMTAGTPLTLSGTVNPSDATHKDIVWSISSNGATGATLSGDTLSATGWGTVVVTATITDGKAVGTPFTKNFTITVDDPDEGNGGDNGNGGGTDAGDGNSDEDANTDLLLIAAVAAAVVLVCAIAAAVLFRRRKKNKV